MTNPQIFISLILISSVVAYFYAKRVAKEGHSFGKVFFITVVGCVGLFFALVKFFNS